MATLNEIVYDLRNMTRGGLLSDDEIMSHEEMVSAADMCVEDLVLELKNDCEPYWL